MMLLRWVPTGSGVRPSPMRLGYAYRIADTTAWNAWLSRVAGRPAADLEVVHRTLRVRDGGPAARIATAASEAKVVPAQTSGGQSATVASSRYENSSTPTVVPEAKKSVEARSSVAAPPTPLSHRRRKCLSPHWRRPRRQRPQWRAIP